MKIKTEQDIIALIQQDVWMMHVLKTVRTLNLPDCWVGAGFVRAKVWDYLHGYEERTPLDDVDVIYFDPSDTNKSTEKQYEAELTKLDVAIPWSVKNQTRMHLRAGEKPYRSSEHALSLWVETATCIAARLNADGKVELLAPWGIEDLISLAVKPTPKYLHKPEEYEDRLAKKNWPAKWPKLIVHHPEK